MLTCEYLYTTQIMFNYLWFVQVPRDKSSLQHIHVLDLLKSSALGISLGASAPTSSLKQTWSDSL